MLTAVKKTDLVFPFTPLTFRLSYFALSQRKCRLTYRPSSSEATIVARDFVAFFVRAAVPEERQLIHFFIRRGKHSESLHVYPIRAWILVRIHNDIVPLP